MLPSGIVFINTDIVDQVRDTIAKQLFITEIFDGYGYDGYIELHPEYPTFVKNNNRRVMVIRPFNDYTNRETADVAIFFSHGNVVVQKNNFGPPTNSWTAADITWQKLCIFGIRSDKRRTSYCKC